ncbi:unnamed protein product [Ceratitis capitata]|uniref:(Mediterranean fruit fly) hypothetical protein n=1 Tax=Ceratitis capitata TaxID=7213 RepID=A0A811VLB8_CERCA|nr:unnamed protein product [Ceratitis capitata]
MQHDPLRNTCRTISNSFISMYTYVCTWLTCKKIYSYFVCLSIGHTTVSRIVLHTSKCNNINMGINFFLNLFPSFSFFFFCMHSPVQLSEQQQRNNQRCLA